MKNKIIGLIIILIVGTIVIWIVAASAGVGAGAFLSLQSFIWVAGIAVGFTLMNYNKDAPKNELFPRLKQNLIFAGYTGALIGSIIMLAGYGGGAGPEVLGMGVSMALLTIFYGYYAAYLLEPFFPK